MPRTLTLALFAALLALPSAAQPAADAPDGAWVQLADGDFVQGRVAMHARGRALPYLSVDGRRYDLHHLQAFASDEGTFGVAQHPASPVPVVVKQVRSGRLALFTSDLAAAGVHGERSGSETLAAAVPEGLSFIRTEDGVLLPVSYRSLREAIGMHPAAKRHLDRYRAMGTLSWIGFGAGAGVAAAGASVWAADANVGVPAPTIVGSGVAIAVVTAFVFPYFRERALFRAVRDYNRAVPRY